MKISDTALGLILGVAGSLIATAICAKYLKKRQQSIRKKIEELDYEEKFIERISKGKCRANSLRFPCVLPLRFYSYIFWSSVLVTHLFPFPKPIETVIYLAATGAWFASAGGCFSYFKSLRSLNDVKAAKEKISNKRQLLSKKL